VKGITYKQIIGYFLGLKMKDKDCILSKDELIRECEKMFKDNCNDWEVIGGHWMRMDLYKGWSD
jgi:hypothetical protein